MYTIEEVEGEFWGQAPPDSSYLMRRIYDLRKKEVGEYDIEDLRIMIGQNEGLAVLIPIAIERLKEDFYAEGKICLL
jgi:hypothetical protein